MRRYSLSHLADAILLRRLASLIVQHRTTTAVMLAHIAEVDSRRLHVPLGYSSMHAYCTEALHLSDDAAYKRIQAARAARRFPALFDLVADGRLHLSAVCLIAPHLTPENFDELVALAIHRGKVAIERALYEHLAADWAAATAAASALAASALAEPESAAAPRIPLAPGQVDPAGLEGPALAPDLLGSAPVQLAPGQVAVAPRSPLRVLRIELTPPLDAKLRHAQALLAHAVPSGDPAAVLDRALDALIAQVEKRRFAPTTRPARAPWRRGPARPTAPRTVPARVRRAIAARDDRRCTFVGADGHRCTTRSRLEFDHVQPLARGGEATVDGMRILCRTHNQYEAERLFGRDFMQRKRQAATQERARAAAGAAAAEIGDDLPRGKLEEQEVDPMLQPAGSGGAGGG